MAGKNKNYNSDDPEDLADLTHYVLATLKRDKRIPYGYTVDSLMSMGYVVVQDLADKYNSKLGVDFQCYVFKFFAGRFFDYFQQNEKGKKRNVKTQDGRRIRPENEPRFIYKHHTNSEKVMLDRDVDESMCEYNSSKIPFEKKLVFSDLNQKQKDVLYLIARGFNQSLIAKLLGLSERRISQIKMETIPRCRIESSEYTLEENEYSIS